MIGEIPVSRLELREVDDDARILAERVSCSPLTALLLRMRGFSGDDPREARAQLDPGLDDSMVRAPEREDGKKTGQSKGV